ncbi:hypothetical protein DXT99_00315 [Pontibacter diazotrophicus]|uniref:IPT/TIG domain-containing protein n=1 Tax=Pontibacter diazotrophicus TaxID=1400979 RepID=A0A3D8LI19_9BACT|nr:IPT/TIG domain-containing protein [Pontibacter diazotrophicus]RDV16998.1 hypothetical protein DXT99_00315 [Pontibacter diazotrophicus]
MKTSFSRYALYLLFFCLCCCAKEEEFPKGLKYPYLEIQQATADDTGIKVSASVKIQGTANVKEYGFMYHLISEKKQNEKRVQVTLTNKKLESVLSEGLVARGNFQIRAYAIVDDKTVYSPPVSAVSLISSRPAIMDFSPKEGPAFTEITITGSSFTTDPYRIEVYIGPIRLQVMAADFDKVVARVPDGKHFGSYPIRVVFNGQEGESEESFKVWGPELVSMSRYEGIPGDTVTLFGKHFSGGRWGPYARLNGLDFKVLSSTDTKLKMEVPFGKPEQFDTPYPVSLTAGEKSAASPFTFTIHSNFGAATATSPNMQYDYVASFEADGKGYFFDFNRVVSYSTTTGQWREESQFPGVPRNFPIWRRIGDKGYLIGGMDGNRYYGDVWEYDFRTATWLKKQSPSFSMYYVASFVLDGKIYFAGGTNSRSSYTLWQYNPQTEQFTELNRVPGYVSYGRAFTRNGKAFLLIQGNVMVYNQAADSWEVDSPFSATDSYALTIGDSEVYLLPLKEKAVLYHYQASTKTWEKAAFYPGCTTDYYYTLRFSGFATSNALYVGAFSSNSTSSCYNRLYPFEP